MHKVNLWGVLKMQNDRGQQEDGQTRQEDWFRYVEAINVSSQLVKRRLQVLCHQLKKYKKEDMKLQAAEVGDDENFVLNKHTKVMCYTEISNRKIGY